MPGVENIHESSSAIHISTPEAGKPSATDISRSETIPTSTKTSPVRITQQQEYRLRVAKEASENIEKLITVFPELRAEMPDTVSNLQADLTKQHQNATCFGDNLSTETWKRLCALPDNPVVRDAGAAFLQKLCAYKSRESAANAALQNLENFKGTSISQEEMTWVAKTREQFEQALAGTTNQQELESVIRQLATTLKSALPVLAKAVAKNPTNIFSRQYAIAVLLDIITLDSSDKASLEAAAKQFLAALNTYDSNSKASAPTIHNLPQEILEQDKSQKTFLGCVIDKAANHAKSKAHDALSAVSKNVVKALLANISFAPERLALLLPFNGPNGPTIGLCWVDPNASKRNNRSEIEAGTRIYFEVDVPHVGLIAAQIFAAKSGEIFCKIFCPEHVLLYFKDIERKIALGVNGQGFKLKDFKISSEIPNPLHFIHAKDGGATDVQI